MIWFLALTSLGVGWVAANAIPLILQRRSAASTISWLFALVFLPFLGLALYWLIGPLKFARRKRRRTIIKRIVDEGLRGMAALHTQSDHQLAMVAVGLGGMPPHRAASVQIYTDGVSAYRAILDAVAAARDHIHLEYYIWEPDAIGTRFRDLLVDRARAGVKVRLLLDAAGSSKLSRGFLRPLRSAGAAVAWFNPMRLRTMRRRRADFRTHRKIVVCDGRVGFTGGMNITDLQSAELSDRYWRDTHVGCTGSAVWPIQRVFFEDWAFAAQELIPITVDTVPPPHDEGEQLVQIVASGPDSSDFAIHKMYFAAINQATRRVWLTTPYFVPDEALITALITTALRGVDVRLLVPARSDSRLVDLAARSYFPELLQAGVRVYEYAPRFIHAKTMLCDDEVAVIGTLNLDYRSFRLNFELAALLFGETTNRTLADAFDGDLRDSRELTLAGFGKLSFLQRLSQASARLLSPLL